MGRVKAEKYKKYRKILKSAQLREEEQKKEKEGVSNGPGEFQSERKDL